MTSWIVRDPSGTLIAQRYSHGQEYYVLFDGQGDVVALEDPGQVKASDEFCPTGNEADITGGTKINCNQDDQLCGAPEGGGFGSGPLGEGLNALVD